MIFIRNIPLKVASLLIALVLAYAVQRAGNISVVSLFVPLEIKNTPEDKMVVKPTKRGAQVTLKGPSFIVGPLAAAPPPLRVKLPDGVGDKATVSLRASDLSLPPSVEVLSIEPAQVDFSLEQLERQEVRVTVPRVGQLAKELVLEGVEVSPKLIMVKGPRSELKQIKTIETEPIDLAVLEESQERTLQLRTLGAAVVPESKTVMARITIGEPPTERIFSRIPVEVRVIGGASSGIALMPSEVALTVSGSPSALTALKEQDLSPYVRLASELNEVNVSSREQVQIQLPLGLRVVKVEPAAVVVQHVKDQTGDRNSTVKAAVKKK